MKMGRERAILRWDIHDTLLRQRLARLEQQVTTFGPVQGPRDRERLARLTAEIEQTRRQLRALGPSPRAKMG